MLSWWRQSAGSKRCVLCHDSATGCGLCAACAADLQSVRTDAAHMCPQCAGISTLGAVCGRCQQKPPPFERLWASVYYEPPASSMLHAFKHLADLSMREPLVEIMRAHPPPWLADAEIGAALAMPLSLQRGWRSITAGRCCRVMRCSDGITHRKARSKAMSANAMCAMRLRCKAAWLRTVTCC